MKHSAESLSKLNKSELTEHVLTLQNQVAKEYRVIPAVPAVPAKEAYTDEQGIKHDAVAEVPAVPAVSIRAQLELLPEYHAYKAECDKIDAANAEAEKAFTENPKVLEITTAKKNAAEFQTANADKFAALAAIKTAMTAKNANMRKLTADYTLAESGITYPADYDLSFEDVPTYTPAAYPEIDTFFPNGVSLNAPASFIFGTKKSAKVASAKNENSGGEKGTGGMADVTDAIKAEVNSIIYANLAAGETAGKGLSKKFPNLSSSTLAILVRTHTK